MLISQTANGIILAIKFCFFILFIVLFVCRKIFCPITYHHGYEEIWDVRQASRLIVPFQQSLRPDFAPQNQTPWSTKTLQLSQIQRLQDFPISTTHAYYGGRRAGQKIVHYADMKRTEILELRDGLVKVDNSGLGTKLKFLPAISYSVWLNRPKHWTTNHWKKYPLM